MNAKLGDMIVIQMQNARIYKNVVMNVTANSDSSNITMAEYVRVGNFIFITKV